MAQSNSSSRASFLEVVSLAPLDEVVLDKHLLHMAFPTKPKPTPRCSSGSQQDSDGQEIGTPCGKTLSAIPYKRRDEDVKALNCWICPECDSWKAWPKARMK